MIGEQSWKNGKVNNTYINLESASHQNYFAYDSIFDVR